MTRRGSNRSPGQMLIPDNLRKRFGRVRFYVRFKLPRSRAIDFARSVAVLGVAKDRQLNFTLTPSDDKTLAVSVHRMRAGASEFHLVVERRRGETSPFRRVPASKLRDFLEFLDSAGQSLALEHWQEWTSVRRDTLIAKLPNAATLLERAKVRVGNRAAAITGFSIATEKQDDKPRAGISLDWGTGDRVTFSVWTDGGALTSIKEAASRGAALIGDLLPETTSAQESEDGDG